MMKCPILLELLQLKEYISAEQERHRRAVEKLLQQSEEKEAVGRRCHCNVSCSSYEKKQKNTT